MPLAPIPLDLLHGCTTDIEVKKHNCDEGVSCRNTVGSFECYKCLPGWGSDNDNCVPQNTELECTATGFTLKLTQEILYEAESGLKPDHEYSVSVNGKNAGTFDENGDITIDEKWDNIPDLTLTHSDDGKLKFKVEISQISCCWV